MHLRSAIGTHRILSIALITASLTRSSTCLTCGRTCRLSRALSIRTRDQSARGSSRSCHVARAGIVDDAALMEMLEQDRIFGAGLDVYAVRRQMGVVLQQGSFDELSRQEGLVKATGIDSPRPIVKRRSLIIPCD